MIKSDVNECEVCALGGVIGKSERMLSWELEDIKRHRITSCNPRLAVPTYRT